MRLEGKSRAERREKFWKTKERKNGDETLS